MIALVSITELRTRTLHETSRGRCLAETISPLVLRIRGEGFVLVIRVPKGFATDAATVPRCLWWLFPPDGLWIRAAVIHDYMYRMGYSRILCDAVFRYVMEHDGVTAWRRCAMFYAVRFGGWRSHSQYVRQQATNNRETT